jgi:hypothetical protein
MEDGQEFAVNLAAAGSLLVALLVVSCVLAGLAYLADSRRKKRWQRADLAEAITVAKSGREVHLLIDHLEQPGGQGRTPDTALPSGRPSGWQERATACAGVRPATRGERSDQPVPDTLPSAA